MCHHFHANLYALFRHFTHSHLLGCPRNRVSSPLSRGIHHHRTVCCCSVLWRQGLPLWSSLLVEYSIIYYSCSLTCLERGSHPYTCRKRPLLCHGASNMVRPKRSTIATWVLKMHSSHQVRCNLQVLIDYPTYLHPPGCPSDGVSCPSFQFSNMGPGKGNSGAPILDVF